MSQLRTSSPPPGILIVGHGSPKAEANAVFEALVSRIGRRLGAPHCLATFFAVARPSIPDRVAELAGRGVRRILLLPYFLFEGHHVSYNIPKIVEECHAQHPGVEITVLPTLEGEEVLEEVVVRNLVEALAEGERGLSPFPPHDSAIRTDAPAEMGTVPFALGDPALPALPTLSDRFAEAVALAAGLHAQQRRKSSGSPFMGHLLRVAGIVLEHGGDEDEAIAALLHDAIEDQGGAATEDLIRERFGPRVAEIVRGCSDTDQTPKPPWRQRKEAYLAHLEHASPSVRLVSAADKLDNLRSLLAAYREHGEAVWQHFKGGREGTLWYHRQVAAALRRHDPSRLLDELDVAVGELERAVDSR